LSIFELISVFEMVKLFECLNGSCGLQCCKNRLNVDKVSPG